MRYVSLCMFTLILFACENVSSPASDVPKTFETGKESNGISDISKRYGGSGDVVNAMYDDIVADDAALKSLEKDIRQIPGTVSGATAVFHAFNNNNSNYYHSATRHINSIKDSALRERIRLVIEQSKNKYENAIEGHNTLLRQINLKHATLDDLHTYLKLVKTLPVLETYQHKNLPATSPLEKVSAEIDNTIQRTKDAGKQ